jgi:electron transfer flavoprotein beta subunit
MNSLVCVAYVPDTETRIKVGAGGTSIDETDVKWIVSPYDEYALEEAIKTKEAKGGSVTVLTLGPERAKTGLRECLARGADEGVWIDAKDAGEIDALTVAREITAVIKEGSYDLVWFGQKGVGGDESLVGPMVAELAGFPQIGNIVKFEIGDRKILCDREIEGGHEHVESPTPCVVTAQKGLNEPRYASLKGIMAAKKKPIQDRALSGPPSATCRTRKLELPPPPRPCHFVDSSDPAAGAREIARLLREEAKVI